MTTAIIHADQARDTGIKRSEAQKAAGQVIRRLLSRVYGDVDRIVTLEVSPSRNLSTVFWSDQQLVAMTINNGRVQYRLVGLTDPDRALIERDPKVDSAERSDRSFNRKPNRCVVGLSCGMTCISDIKTCQLSLKSVASQSEQKVLSQAMSVLRSSSKEKSKYEGRSLRDLQKEARERGVYRANHQRKDELIQTLEALDKDPQSQERLRKTLEKRKSAQKEVDKRLGTPWKVWKEFQRLSRVAGANPQASMLLMTSLLGGFAAGQYQRVKKSYQSRFDQSAETAFQRAEGIKPETVRRGQIMFAVGGYASTGSTADALKRGLEIYGGDQPEAFIGKNHIVSVEHTDFDIEFDGRPKKDSQGNYHPTYLGRILKNGAGKFVRNAVRGQNDAAIDLAAQLYAYGRDYPGKPINVLAHDVGGNITREAVEILARMNPGEGLNGQELLGRIKVVALGTNYWGLTDSKKAWGIGKNNARYQTITGVGDPFSRLPMRNAEYVTGLSGREIEDFLSNPYARRRINEAFGGTAPSRTQERDVRQAREARRQREISMVLPPVNTRDDRDPRNAPDFYQMPLAEQGRALEKYRKALEKDEQFVRIAQLNQPKPASEDKPE